MEGVESIMFEIIRKRQKNIIGGCIYRHPFNDRTQFHEPGMAKSENENIYIVPMENTAVYALYVLTHILSFVRFYVIFYKICHRLKAFYTYLI